MKLTGLFRKQTGTQEVKTSNVEESLTKLWQKQHGNIFTAAKARELADDKTNFTYLDTNVIKTILENVQRAACRHQTSCSGGIGTMTLSQEEIDYCIRFLSNAGYQNISIYNVSKPNVYPNSVEYSLTW